MPIQVSTYELELRQYPSHIREQIRRQLEGGTSTKPLATPPSPRRSGRPALTWAREGPQLAALFAELQELADAHGWQARYTYSGPGEREQGLHVLLVRETVLHLELYDTTSHPVTRAQRDWVQDLRRAQQEAYLWGPQDRDAMQARLTRPSAHE